jgi:lipid-A-disaccharide synthase
MVVAYKLERWFAELLRHRILAPSIVLPNLILEEKAFPEFIQEHCTPENLTDALEPLMRDGPERQRQLEAIAGLAGRMRLEEGTPSGRAAGVVLDLVKENSSQA